MYIYMYIYMCIYIYMWRGPLCIEWRGSETTILAPAAHFFGPLTLAHLCIKYTQPFCKPGSSEKSVTHEATIGNLRSGNSWEICVRVCLYFFPWPSSNQRNFWKQMFSQMNMGQNLRLEGSQVFSYYSTCQVKVSRFQQRILWNTTMSTQTHATRCMFFVEEL